MKEDASFFSLSRCLQVLQKSAAPSAVSGDCAGHCGESRAPSGDNAAEPLLQSLETAPATAERAGPPAATTRAAVPSAIGDNACRSPFCSLTAERAGPPAATTRAAAPSAVSGDCAGPAERAGPPAATTRAAAPSAVSGDYAGHCGCEM